MRSSLRPTRSYSSSSWRCRLQSPLSYRRHQRLAVEASILRGLQGSQLVRNWTSCQPNLLLCKCRDVNEWLITVSIHRHAFSFNSRKSNAAFNRHADRKQIEALTNRLRETAKCNHQTTKELEGRLQEVNADLDQVRIPQDSLSLLAALNFRVACQADYVEGPERALQKAAPSPEALGCRLSDAQIPRSAL